jgi:hypothetical protein
LLQVSVAYGPSLASECYDAAKARVDEAVAQIRAGVLRSTVTVSLRDLGEESLAHVIGPRGEKIAEAEALLEAKRVSLRDHGDDGDGSGGGGSDCSLACVGRGVQLTVCAPSPSTGPGAVTLSVPAGSRAALPHLWSLLIQHAKDGRSEREERASLEDAAI